MADFDTLKTIEQPLYKWAIDNMTQEEVSYFRNSGWQSQEEHCLYLAAMHLDYQRLCKLKRNFLGRWYLSDEEQQAKG